MIQHARPEEQEVRFIELARFEFLSPTEQQAGEPLVLAVGREGHRRDLALVWQPRRRSVRSEGPQAQPPTADPGHPLRARVNSHAGQLGVVGVDFDPMLATGEEHEGYTQPFSPKSD